MSYDLEAIDPAGRPAPPGELEARAKDVLPAGLVLTARPGGYRCDGDGFTVTPTARGARLSAGPARGPDDERAMELCALAIALPDGEVLDRHTGRHWPAALLREWLGVTGLFSGRALAVNEERIARRGAGRAAGEFAARVELLTQRAASGGSAAFLARLRDELGYYATRPAMHWPVARGLARLGDLSRLEALARNAPADAASDDAFAIAADLGRAALPLFANALGDADPNHRRAAARALHRLSDPAVLPLVARALEDRRATVREVVLETGFERILALPGASTVLGPVLARMANDPNSTIRRLSARWTGSSA